MVKAVLFAYFKHLNVSFTLHVPKGEILETPRKCFTDVQQRLY